jgi:hypothetical protein
MSYFVTFSREHRLLERLDPGVHVRETPGQLLVHAVHVALRQLCGERVRAAQLFALALAATQGKNGLNVVSVGLAVDLLALLFLLFRFCAIFRFIFWIWSVFCFDAITGIVRCRFSVCSCRFSVC